MLNTAIDFLRVNPSPTRDEIREAMSAVICRCTGYRDIVNAIEAAAKKMRSS
jgi:aerobic-type carbon monoxide dehydrogenase small subunit (CoxS/CutS family)